MAYTYTKEDVGKCIYFLHNNLGVATHETEVIVSDEITLLNDSCFDRCGWIKTITIPDSVTHISNRVFRGCTGLTTITIPNSVSSIGIQVFDGCANLTDIELSDQIKTIGYRMFGDCKNLKKLTLPSVQRFVSPTVFMGCDLLESVIAPNIILEDTIPGYKPLLMAGFIESPELFSEEKAIKFKKYILTQKRRLLSVWIKKDYVLGIEFLAKNNAITIKNFDSLFFAPAQAAEAKQCVSYLLDWKNKNLSMDDEFKIISRELNRKPTEISTFKKLWKYDIFKDNTIALTCYLGNDQDITIPEKVGKYTVFRLNKTVFDTPRCENVQKIHIPKSVTEIRRLSFDCLENATIYAPSGSCAEQYAKENGIPFVAEEI